MDKVDWWYIDFYITIRCPCGNSFEWDGADGIVICADCNALYEYRSSLVKVNEIDTSS